MRKHAFVSENTRQISVLISINLSLSEWTFLLKFFLTSSFCTSLTWEVFCQADLIIIYVCFLPKMHLFRLLLGFHVVHKLNLTNRRALVWRIARKSKLYEDVIQVYGPKPPCSTSINFLNFKGNMALNFAVCAQKDFKNIVRRIESLLWKVDQSSEKCHHWIRVTTTEENQGSSRMGLFFFVCCRVIDCFCWQTVRFSWDEVTTPQRWST